MDLIGKLFLMIIDFLLTRKTIIEFISCPTKLRSSGFPVRAQPFAAAILCSKTSTSVISNAAALGLDVVYQVAVAYQVVYVCRCLLFFTLVVFFLCGWWDYITVVEIEDYPSSLSSSSPSAFPSLHSADSPLMYDVFLSFRGPDTREKFMSHLAEALWKSGIEAFIDSKLEKGEENWAGLMDAIERSKISVVVLSENYASSRCCLYEVEKIMECRRTRGQIVLPVFYGVKPAEVRRQNGKYRSAFEKYEKASKNAEMAEKIKRWRDAFTEIAGIFGFDSDVVRSESELLNDIVKHVLDKLESLSFCKDERLIGAYSQVIEVEELLEENGSDDVQRIGIWGMGGIGKTAIAAAVFNRRSRHFKSCCFVGNIRERSRTDGLTSLRNDLLRKILDQNDIDIATPDIISSIKISRLRRKRALIVLDDVSSFSQLEFLDPEPSYFGCGSRIIITTRDKDVIKNVDAIHLVERLPEDDALELFSRCAFRQNYPPENYLELSKRVIVCAHGNPGAIRTLGLFLGKKTVVEWESELRRLQRFLNEDIYHTHHVSYDGLSYEGQKIFLDAAYFFKGERRSSVTEILNGCGFSADIGIRELVDKSLITFSGDRLMFHDFFEKMSKKIVLEQADQDSSRCSRLRDYVEAHEILTENMGAGSTEGIFLDLSEEQEMSLGPQAFARMRNLRILRFLSNRCGEENCKVFLREGLESLPKNLRWLEWDSFPLKTLPVGFQPEHLVELCMRNSRLERLWEGDKKLNNLKGIDLSYSTSLKEMPDLSTAPRLERVILRGCTDLVRIPTPKTNLKSLQLVDLSGCSSLRGFSEIGWNPKELILDESSTEDIPS